MCIMTQVPAQMRLLSNSIGGYQGEDAESTVVRLNES